MNPSLLVNPLNLSSPLALLFSITHPLLLIVLGGALCLGLNWLIGGLRKRALRDLVPTPEPGAPPTAGADEIAGTDSQTGGTDGQDTSVRRLVVEWIAKGLRMLLWLLYGFYLLVLLPHTRTQVESASGRLRATLFQLDDWLLNRGLSTLVVLVVTLFLMRFVAALIRTAFEVYERSIAEPAGEYRQRRTKTLSTIFRGISQTAIFFIGLMVALQQAGLNITPILASAGIVGIAVGFGAQSLVKDFFSGLLILLEDQYSVGDTVKIGDVTGTVEVLTLRATRVRGLDGSLTVFPNGSISTVSNFSKEWCRAVLDVEVDYAEDVDRAMRLMLEAAQQFKQEQPSNLTDEPTMLGLDKVANGTATLRMIAKTPPGKQAEVGRELRRRVKLAFEHEGIKGPVRVERPA